MAFVRAFSRRMVTAVRNVLDAYRKDRQKSSAPIRAMDLENEIMEALAAHFNEGHLPYLGHKAGWRLSRVRQSNISALRRLRGDRDPKTETLAAVMDYALGDLEYSACAAHLHDAIVRFPDDPHLVWLCRYFFITPPTRAPEPQPIHLRVVG